MYLPLLHASSALWLHHQSILDEHELCLQSWQAQFEITKISLYSSPENKVLGVSYSDRFLSVCLSICMSVRQLLPTKHVLWKNLAKFIKITQQLCDTLHSFINHYYNLVIIIILYHFHNYQTVHSNFFNHWHSVYSLSVLRHIENTAVPVMFNHWHSVYSLTVLRHIEYTAVPVMLKL